MRQDIITQQCVDFKQEQSDEQNCSETLLHTAAEIPHGFLSFGRAVRARAPLNEAERRDVWEICEDSYQTRSVILTPQMPVVRWHEQIADPTVADGIPDA